MFYLLPAVTSTAVNSLGAQVKFSISGPYTPMMLWSLTIFETESSPLLITCIVVMISIVRTMDLNT